MLIRNSEEKKKIYKKSIQILNDTFFFPIKNEDKHFTDKYYVVGNVKQ